MNSVTPAEEQNGFLSEAGAGAGAADHGRSGPQIFPSNGRAGGACAGKRWMPDEDSNLD